MFGSLDLGTLQQCGMLTSLSFAAVFAVLWRGRRDRMFLLYAAMAAGPILIVAGVRLFDGRPPLARWMIVPILFAAGGQAAGQALGGATGIRLGAAGLAAVAVAIAVALLRSRPDLRADMRRDGRRLTGVAMLGHLPGHVWVIATGVVPAGMAAEMMALDQVLTILVNLGLLAMPGRRAIAIMRERNHRDPLTGAHSRAWLAKMATSLAIPGATVIVIDVDHFKRINDSLGHGAGDAVLIGLVRRLDEPVRAKDGRIVRLGGDEFAAILPAATGLSMGAAMRLAKLLGRIAAMAPADVPACTISVGVAQVEAGDDRLDRAIARADRALYRAKAGGRDRVAA